MHEELHEEGTFTIWLEPAEYMQRLKKRAREEFGAFSITEEMVEGEFGKTYLSEDEQREMFRILNKMRSHLEDDMRQSVQYFNEHGFVPDKADLMRQYPERN